VSGGPLYLYGIVGGGAPLPPRGLRGVGGGGVRVVTEGALGALVTDLPHRVYEARREDLVAHSDVLQTVVDSMLEDRRDDPSSTCVLPMGFGTVFDSATELAGAFLRPNHDALAGMLEDVRGFVEVQVRADYDPDGVARTIAASDRTVQKLQARARSRGDVESRIELGRRFAAVLEERRYADGRTIVDRLAPVAHAASLGEVTGEYGLLRASFLVARDELGRFDEAAAAAAGSLGEQATVRCIGPLPPYSFVDASALAVG
jgi:hypothetical protein